MVAADLIFDQLHEHPREKRLAEHGVLPVRTPYKQQHRGGHNASGTTLTVCINAGSMLMLVCSSPRGCWNGYGSSTCRRHAQRGPATLPLPSPVLPLFACHDNYTP